MMVLPVDPRDQVEGVDDPRYRVYFWDRDQNRSDEYEITGADVHEVLAWADHNVRGRTYSVWVSLPTTGQGVNLLRLTGWHGPDDDEGRPQHAVILPTHGRA